MLPQLFFIGLYTFLSSAIELEGFKDITTELQHSQVRYYGWSVEHIDLPENIDELEGIKKCAEACLDAKYVCKVFTVTYLRPNILGCKLFRIPASRITTVFDHSIGSSVIFEILEPEPLEPVIERFLYDYKMPENLWADRLVNGYGLARDFMPEYFWPMIRACKTAMYSDPAIAIDFERRSSVRDISESQRPITDLEAFSDKKILELVKSWEEFSEKTEFNIFPDETEQKPSESFATIFLTFLEIFCPHIRQGTTTIYDPIKKVLFIDNEDIHILVASFGPRYAIVRDHYVIGRDHHAIGRDNYAIVRDQPKTNDDSDVVVYLTYSENTLDDKTIQNETLDLFQQARKLKTTIQYSKNIIYNTDSIAHLLLNVIQALLDPKPDSYYYPGPSGLIFCRDLITAVLSHIYGKKYKRTRMFSALNTTLQSKKFTDISVIPDIIL